MDKGKIKILSNMPPRNPIVNTAITDPKRLKIGVPRINVIKSAIIILLDSERNIPSTSEVIMIGIPNVIQ